MTRICFEGWDENVMSLLLKKRVLLFGGDVMELSRCLSMSVG